MSNAPTHSVHSAIATGPLLLLLFFLIGCLAPGAALAVDGSDALNFRTISDGCGPFGVGKYEAQDTSISYCMNQDCPGPSKPGGPWRTYNRAGHGSMTNLPPSSVTDTPPIHPLAATICRPISLVPPPRLPCGCSTEPRAPTAPIRIQIARELPGAVGFTKTPRP